MEVTHLLDRHFLLPAHTSAGIIEDSKYFGNADPELRGGVIGAVPDADTYVEYKGKSLKIILYINVVCGVKTNDVMHVPLPGANTQKRKFLVPYQFTGLVTAPADGPRPDYLKLFFQRVFRTFFEFMRFVISLPGMTWAALVQYILSGGSPDHVTRAWKSIAFLEDQKNHIDVDYNPLIPSDVLPVRGLAAKQLSAGQTGLGIYTGRASSNRLTQLIDNSQKVVSSRINNLNSAAGWFIVPDASDLYIQWLSNDYNYIDGECFGSFLYLEEV